MVGVDVDLSGRSAAWLAHLLWEQRVARSNRVAPTYFYESVCHGRSFFLSVRRVRASQLGIRRRIDMNEEAMETGAATRKDATRVDLRNPWIAAALTWILPGVGHFFQRRYFKGLVFGASVWSLAIAGVVMGSYRVETENGAELYVARNVYCSWRPGDMRIAFIPQSFVGLYAIPAIAQYREAKSLVQDVARGVREPEREHTTLNAAFAPPQISSEMNARPKQPTANDIAARLQSWLDVALLYSMSAGFFNLLAIFDALGGPNLIDEKKSKQNDSNSEKQKKEETK